jgi:heme-degrading monooxygenase HmoA
VTFETWPDEKYQNTYLEHAQNMRREVERIQGFISVERFQSLYEDGKLLSMSLWESEDAIRQWRENAEHQLEQELGKTRYFHSYHIRVARVEREYGNHS